MHSLIVFRTCIPGHSIAQFFFFGMILRESPKVTEAPANLHKASKETRNQQYVN